MDEAVRKFHEQLRPLENGVAKRFLMIHSKRHGMKALDEFWKKLCESLRSSERKIFFSSQEISSIVEAQRHPSIFHNQFPNRREMLKIGGGWAGLVLAGSSAWLAGNYEERKKNPNLPIDERNAASTYELLNAGLSLSAMAGGSILLVRGVQEYDRRYDNFTEMASSTERLELFVIGLKESFEQINKILAERHKNPGKE